MNILLKNLVFLSFSGFLLLTGCSAKNVVGETYSSDKISTVLPTNTPSKETGRCSKSEKDVVLQKISGNWLNEDLISSLKEKKSFIKSVIQMPYFQINLQDNEYVLMGATSDFHQGGLYQTNIADIYKSDDKFYFNVSKDANPDCDTQEGKSGNLNPKMIINNDKIEYLCGDIKRSFIKINEPPQRYISKVLLEGKYVDEKGDSYKFTNDNVAVWPNLKSQYTLLLDGIIGDDVFIMGDPTDGNVKYYSYEFKDNKLYIYSSKSSDDSMSFIRSKEPVAILKKVK